MSKKCSFNRFLIASLLTIPLLMQVALAAKPIYSGGKDRAAIRGYDPVAYFLVNEAVRGNKEISLQYKGATWFFASEGNRALFEQSPEKYAPQYGGYCAYAIARNNTASSKPEFFIIHNDKLYLNYSKSVYKRWLQDKQGYINEADQNWPSVIDK